MRRTHTVLAVLFAVGGLNACTTVDLRPACPATAEGPPVLDQPFQLRHGATAVLRDANLSLRFSRLVQDSRCPPGAQCIWEGMAQIELVARQTPGAAQRIALDTQARQNAPYGPYDLTLSGLMPRPLQGVPVSEGDYCATLRVTRR